MLRGPVFFHSCLNFLYCISVDAFPACLCPRCFSFPVCYGYPLLLFHFRSSVFVYTCSCLQVVFLLHCPFSSSPCRLGSSGPYWSALACVPFPQRVDSHLSLVSWLAGPSLFPTVLFNLTVSNPLLHIFLYSSVSSVLGWLPTLCWSWRPIF